MITDQNGRRLELADVLFYHKSENAYRLTHTTENVTIEAMADFLTVPGNQTLICRSGARARLTSELKRRLISTHHQKLPDGNYLFTRCEARSFKS